MKILASNLKKVMDKMREGDERSVWFQPLSSRDTGELLGLVVMKVDEEGGSEITAYSFQELDRLMENGDVERWESEGGLCKE
jgi:hypothetical protein